MAHKNCNKFAPNFVKCIAELQNTFNKRFHDFGLQEQNIIFCSVFYERTVDAEYAPTELQTELID